jgi:hypothetical protein
MFIGGKYEPVTNNTFVKLAINDNILKSEIGLDD